MSWVRKKLEECNRKRFLFSSYNSLILSQFVTYAPEDKIGHLCGIPPLEEKVRLGLSIEYDHLSSDPLQ